MTKNDGIPLWFGLGLLKEGFHKDSVSDEVRCF